MSKSRNIFNPVMAKYRHSTLAEALARNTEQRGECLVWTGTKGESGYGEIQRLHVRWLTHRLAWTLANGPIPAAMEVCHHCDNPACVRIEHLFVGTHAENMRDMLAKGRHGFVGSSRSGEDHPTAKLTKIDVIWIRYLRSLGATHKRIAEIVGGSLSNARAICSGKTWQVQENK
jgi:hypothetical protein